MSKIAIISQPDKGVLIDVTGCQSITEAAEHLTWTLETSSQFWRDMNIDLNLGKLSLNSEEVAQIVSIAQSSGVRFHQVFAQDVYTVDELKSANFKIGVGEPMSFPATDENGLVKIEPQAVTPEEFNSVAAGPGCELFFEEDQGRSHYGPKYSGPAVLCIKQTLRSGQTVSHKGHLVIIGDVNPGAEVMAEGDITIWGTLRGIAHAGNAGDTKAEIRALKLKPMQLRIATAIARAPDRTQARSTTSGAYKGAETARVINGQIRISIQAD